MQVKTTVGQVTMVGGSQVDPSDGILVEEPTSRFSRGRSRGSLYVLLDISGRGAGRQALSRELITGVRNVYYGQRGSITAGLQQAIQEANRLVFEENRNSLPGEQWSAGITCMVLRSDDLFIAQAGPSAAYLAHDGHVTRFPDVSPWLDSVLPEEVDAAELGARRDAHVDLFHVQVSHGDVALLVNAGLAHDLSPQAWPPILGKPSATDIVHGLVAASRGRDLSAVVLRLEGEEVTVAARPATVDNAPLPPRQPVWDSISRRLGELEVREWLNTAGRSVGAILAGLWVMLVTLLKRTMPDTSSPQPRVRRQTSLVREAKTKPRGLGRQGRDRSDLVQKILIVAAVAIPVIVAGVVLFVVVQGGHTQAAEVNQLRDNATRSWQQAQAASDPAEIRTYLTTAEGYVKQWTERKPNDAEAADLQKKIQSRLDEINQVRRINWVGDLKTYPSGADLTRVVVEGAHVFVMDRNAGKVYHHQLDEFQQALQPETADNVLVSKGQQVDGVLVADLVDMAWVPVGEGRQKANLAILESGGNVLEYDPTTGELKPLRLAASNALQFPTLVGSYYGRFYVLDSTANKIWRYQPTLDGYSEPPDDWLKAEVDLLGVTDMAIGNSIYLLYTDGRIRKFTAGEPDTFDISDWDIPPHNPSALFTLPPEDTQWVYVADRGNSRIVQCAKDGKFKRQFRLADSEESNEADPLSTVTSLYVDEISGHAFFLSGGKLYIIVLPE
jgi:hypothetical protein